MAEFESATGADVNIRIAPFADAMALKSAITRELSKTGIDLEGISAESDVLEFVDPVVKAVLALDSSPDVYAALFSCLKRCTYNGEKITEQTFEKAEARKDYYEIVFACIKENLLPFFEGLLSKLSERGLTLDKILKSK